MHHLVVQKNVEWVFEGSLDINQGLSKVYMSITSYIYIYILGVEFLKNWPHLVPKHFKKLVLAFTS